MVVKFPCTVCLKCVKKNDRAVQCDFCEGWTHIRCNSISPSKYIDFQNDDNNDNFICLTCLHANLPFSYINDESLELTVKHGSNIDESALDHIDININRKEQKNIKQITNLIIETTDPENTNANFCKYYTIDDFCNKKFSPKNTTSLFHMNIHSLQYHIEDLHILLNTLDFKFDIIAISETKLRKGVEPSKHIDIPSYEYIHTPTEASKGGTLIYISNRIENYKPRKDLEIYIPRKLESTFIEIISSKGKNTIIGCIYKHHNISEIEFNAILKPLAYKLKTEGKPCWITGDFNMDLLKIENDTHINDYFDIFTNNNFMPLITLPTRITNRTKTLIDNIYYNQFSNNIVSGNITVGISDHIPQFAIIPSYSNNTIPTNNTSYVRNYKKMNNESFVNTIRNIDWSFANSNTDTDTNEVIVNFLGKITSALDDHAPLRKITKKQHKKLNKPWITKGIIKSIRNKEKIYNQYLRETILDKKTTLEKEFKKRKNMITILLRKSKKNFYNNYFQEHSKNTRKIWAGINNLINAKPTASSLPSCLEVNISKKNTFTITEPSKIANTFNNYFASIADNILKTRKYTGNKHFSDYLRNPNPNTFLLTPTDKVEVETLIKLSNTNKSTGPNSIPNQVIKLISSHISEPLTNIANKIFATGKYPDTLKISKIIPIHKKDSKLSVSNYRPISLLSNINRILEKLLFNRLYNFLEIHNCIYELQFGFRAKHSTDHALLSMAEEIRNAMNNNEIAVGVFVDFQKAFDTVNHNILITKLHHYGIRGIANQLLKSYLTDRQQFVSIHGTESNKSNILHGVPQGSVLGPLLFLVYINDLHTCIHNSKTRHFADDTNLLHIIKNKIRNKNPARRLNQDLKSLNNWLLANKISLNSTKTELIYFRKQNLPIPDLNIRLNGIKLQPVSEVKYVGLIIDEHMSFKSHIRTLNAKLKRANNLIAISRHYVPKKLLTQIYYGQFYSHLTYGCMIYGQNNDDISTTFTLQKKAIRLMSFSDYQAPTKPLFKKLELLTLNHIITTKRVLFVHNALNCKLPKHFENHFEVKATLHTHRTVNHPNSLYSIPTGSVVLPNISVRNSRTSFRYSCGQAWNSTLKKLATKLKELNKPPLEENWMQKLPLFGLRKLINRLYIES